MEARVCVGARCEMWVWASLVTLAGMEMEMQDGEKAKMECESAKFGGLCD